MSNLSRLYRESLALLTDLYQLTMAYGYWRSGEADTEAVFHLFFRKQPFHGGFTIACGLEPIVELLRRFRFEESDLSYLATLTGNNGEPLFERVFLDELRDMTFTCDVDAVPEGSIVFPHQPMLRIKGPLMQCQLLETALLNIMNFQTLIATKAARVVMAARGEPVLEFGLRRAQGIDGGISASRAAYVGGVAATSNVLAGKLYGIPVKGTHAHSWVMCFDSELEAFQAYADAMPNNCVFLVDTYDTIEGVRRAIKVGEKLRERGHEMIGVRLDSGDLAYLSIEARRLLDEAGFEQASVVASNSLDEHIIKSLKEQGAQINVWGVGTKLSASYDQPALGGVYKLGAVRRQGGEWQPRIKLSEQAIKVSNPGILQVRRFFDAGEYVGDMIFDERRQFGPDDDFIIVDPMDMTRRKRIARSVSHEDLLVPVFRAGQYVGTPETLEQIRGRVTRQLELFHTGIKRFTNPHQYPVGLERELFDTKTALIMAARGFEPGTNAQEPA